jgi:predicted cobalt transporter CbtA
LIIRTLLLRGMLVGVIAGLFSFTFARLVGEPQVEKAIAFETTLDHSRGEMPESEIISRKIQKSVGLLTGVVVYGAAIGGLFGLTFAFAVGRISVTKPRALSALLALLGFVAVVLVPQLKYPANPPAVGNPETIGIRTATFFLLIAFSVAAAVLSLQVGRHLSLRYGAWNGHLLAAALFLIVVTLVSHFLPEIDEVPAGFPVTLMWRFRIAALEIQGVMWASLGLLFGWLTERNQSRSHI